MARRGPFTIYYDAGCPFCIRTIKLFRLLLPVRGPTYAAQSDPERHDEMKEKKSWIVVCADGEHQYGWRAVATVVSDSPWLWPLGKIMALPFLQRPGEWFYHWIERHRPLLTKLTDFVNADLPVND